LRGIRSTHDPSRGIASFVAKSAKVAGQSSRRFVSGRLSADQRLQECRAPHAPSPQGGEGREPRALKCRDR
jgi:hypothetical protein